MSLFTFLLLSLVQTFIYNKSKSFNKYIGMFLFDHVWHHMCLFHFTLV